MTITKKQIIQIQAGRMAKYKRSCMQNIIPAIIQMRVVIKNITVAILKPIILTPKSIWLGFVTCCAVQQHVSVGCRVAKSAATMKERIPMEMMNHPKRGNNSIKKQSPNAT
ncbi:hypothetical protein [Bartonella sp. DGB2]|uniref:hypothetical protein n=1 Tax=Bartonella sp. DGB2 TaxID=3388426 RepID=UPI00398FE27D